MHRFVEQTTDDGRRTTDFYRSSLIKCLLPAVSWQVLLACGLAVWWAGPAAAQSAGEPFETLEVRVSSVQNLNRNFLHQYWDQGIGGEASAATPFYLGFAEVGGAFHRYAVVSPNVPAFNAVLVYAGWGLAVEPFSRLRLEASTRLGNYRMSFDDVTFTGVRNESELAIMVQGRILLRPIGPVSLHVGGSYLKSYTFLRLKLWYVSAGLAYRFRSPSWLRTFLR